MLFPSWAFLLGFLPVALLGYYGLARAGARWAAGWLGLVSVLFYGWSDPRLLVLLGGSIGFNFIAGAFILRLEGKERAQGATLAGAVGANLLLLFYYKYLATLLAFGAAWGVHLSRTPWSIALPLGISFFTFTQVGYLIDCRAGVVRRSHFLDYLLFVTFFPHLVAGPILHHREMIPQFADPRTYVFRLENLLGGTLIFVLGMAKKVCLADPLSYTVATVFDAPVISPAAITWVGVIAYSLQLYFDFSGYSDMALGLARMFGVRFPLNFHSPYRAASMIDFWQRWHMTLTRYLTLYLYNPLALALTRRRAAAGLPIGAAATRAPAGFLLLVAWPIFFTMTLAGVWHGAGLQFIIFGLLHASYLVVNHAWRTFRPKRTGPPSRLATGASILLTYLAAVVAEVFFRASSAGTAWRLLGALGGGSGGAKETVAASPPPAPTLADALAMAPWLAVLLGVVWFLPNTAQIFHRFEPSLTKFSLESPVRFAWQPTWRWACLVALCLVFILLGLNGTSEFSLLPFLRKGLRAWPQVNRTKSRTNCHQR